MIKAIIVDDEALVRKGLITIMPWHKFGVEIAGEAMNGSRALDLMAKQQVDLLFTDLMMPEMNGMELMKYVKETYPRTAVVVLTCHQDFQYIQEALRLGAIDYILKTQLENEVMEEVLGRIVGRYKELQASTVASKEETLREGLLFYPDSPEAAVTALEQHFGTAQLRSIGKGAWFAAKMNTGGETGITDWLISPAGTGWLAVEVNGFAGATFKEMQEELLRYLETGLFYEYNPADRYYIFDKTGGHTEQSEVVIEGHVREWSALLWTTDREHFVSSLEGLKKLRLPPKRLRSLFYSVLMEWTLSMVSVAQSTEWMQRLENFAFWHQWRQWLEEVRDRIRQQHQRSHIPDEIASAIYKAVEYMRLQSDISFTQEQVAAVANMSRAYFSQCFKQITGKSFFDYVRDLRLSQAKRLLLTTNKPIYAIAEQSGFKDERYFSRMFLAEVGILPSEFRNQNLNDKNPAKV